MSKILNIKKFKSFKITNKTETTAEILIYDQIGGGFWSDGVTSKSFSEELKALPKTVKNLEIRLNSPGGSVFEGYTIYNRLVDIKKKKGVNITVYVDGLAASIASLIMLAGDKIVMGEVAQVMIHKPLAGVVGNANELESMINKLDAIEEQLLKVYQKKTGMDYEELRLMLDGPENEDGTWMTSEEALEFGFVDEIMSSEDEIDMAACLEGAHWIKNAPKLKSSSDIVKKELSNLINKIEKYQAR